MRTIRSSVAASVVVAIAIFLLAACTTGPAPSTAGSPSAPGASGGTGDGMLDASGDWRLVEGSSGGVAIPIVPDADITLTVEGSRVSGRAACNQYGGEVVVADGQVRFGPLAMTEMACDEPLMTAEAAFLGAMGDVRAASLDDDRLTLTGDGVQLVFERS